MFCGKKFLRIVMTKISGGNFFFCSLPKFCTSRNKIKIAKLRLTECGSYHTLLFGILLHMVRRTKPLPRSRKNLNIRARWERSSRFVGTFGVF